MRGEQWCGVAAGGPAGWRGNWLGSAAGSLTLLWTGRADLPPHQASQHNTAQHTGPHTSLPPAHTRRVISLHSQLY